VTIDGVDVSQVPLARLRSSMAIIPQDPTLFEGTFRSNLDPFDSYSDSELWRVLDRTKIASLVRNNGILKIPCIN
jgi:ABC-type multidrug transport system fused ATPase/permease subunit